MLRQSLTVVVLVALCVKAIVAFPSERSGSSKSRGSRRYNVGAHACSIQNGTEVTTKTCGCGTETPTSCGFGPLDLTDEFDNLIKVSFCEVVNDFTSTEPFKGVLGSACLVEDTTVKPPITLRSRSCPGNPCPGPEDGSSFTFDVSGKQHRATFCDNDLVLNEKSEKSPMSDDEGAVDEQPEGEEPEGEEPEGEEPEGDGTNGADMDPEGATEDKDDECVCLECKRSHGKPKKTAGGQAVPRRKQGKDSSDSDSMSEESTSEEVMVAPPSPIARRQPQGQGQSRRKQRQQGKIRGQDRA